MLLSTALIESVVKRYRLPARLYIAYSGGIDSHVLLHLFASMEWFKQPITAVYVHHGLQPEADFWAEHCEKTARNLGVDFVALPVKAAANRGESPEEAARNARYAALKSLIEADDMLAVAQHRDDQLETVLLQLFRGAGLRGISGMPEYSPFGRGVMLRPLLQVPKAAMNDYAKLHRLNWVEDPSNQLDHYDRNFLRNAILPLLKQRWPAIDKTVARSAGHCADARRLLDEWIENQFQPVFDPSQRTLDLPKLAALGAAQRNQVLRRWFVVLGLKPPSQAVLETIVNQALQANNQAHPEILHRGYFIKRYRQQLFCVAAASLSKESGVIPWPAQNTQLLLTNGSILTRYEAASGISKQLWETSQVTVTSRRGGERIKPAGRSGHHELKKLYQETGIPPWEREVIPLIYLNGQLAAIAGLWIDEWAWSQDENGCYRLDWHSDAAKEQGLSEKNQLP